MQPYEDPNELTDFSERELKYYIHSLMLTIGVPGGLKGNRYLSYMIEAVYNNPVKIQNVMSGLYKETADEFGTKVSNVERDCRTVIAHIVRTERYSDFCKRLECVRFGEPSVRDLVALLANALRRGLVDDSYMVSPFEKLWL